MDLPHLLGMLDPWERQLAKQYHNQPDYYVLSTCPYFSAPARQRDTGTSEVVNTDKEFKITMDVRHFKPEEIKITSKNNRLIVEARHEEQEDEHGFIAREFRRQYVLPKDVDPAAVTSSLKADGTLTLKAPKKAIEAPTEIPIPITMETDDRGDGK